MPELAEVEFYRRQWDPGLGQKIVAVQLHAQKRIFRGSDPRAMKRELTGRRFLRSFAWGKQMLFQFSGGNWIGIHLGMTENCGRSHQDSGPKNTITLCSAKPGARWFSATRGSSAACGFITEKLHPVGGDRARPTSLPRLSIARSSTRFCAAMRARQ